MNSNDFRPSAFAGFLGVARTDVTPPFGIYARQWGAATHDVAEGIHRPLVATVLTLQSAPDSESLVLIALDGAWWHDRDDEWFVRGFLLDKLNLNADRLIINLSHTHAGPSLCRDDAAKPGGDLIEPYLEKMREALLQATKNALETAQRGYMTWNSGWCDVAQNRDLPDPDALSERPRRVCGWNPGAPADGALLVARATSENGRTLATIVNYACHPTTLAWQNRLISPDWVGAMRETVENASAAPCLFLQGASGELAPREQYTGDCEIAESHGRRIGFAALSALEGVLPPCTALHYAGVAESGAPLALWERTDFEPSTVLEARRVQVELPLKASRSRKEIEAELKVCTDSVQSERLRRAARVRKTVGDGETWAMPLWIWRVGDAAFVAGPHEAYSQSQTELRRAMAPRAVAVLNVSNGSAGYLPPAPLYDEDIYQVWQSPFARGSLEKVIAATQQGAQSLF